jgi:hypothetical protein
VLLGLLACQPALTCTEETCNAGPTTDPPPAPIVPTRTLDTLHLLTHCADWTVWELVIDGVRYRKPGDLWAFPPEGALDLVRPFGAHHLDATRWSPTLGDASAALTALPYLLPCE